MIKTKIFSLVTALNILFNMISQKFSIYNNHAVLSNLVKKQFIAIQLVTFSIIPIKIININNVISTSLNYLLFNCGKNILKQIDNLIIKKNINMFDIFNLYFIFRVSNCYQKDRIFVLLRSNLYECISIKYFNIFDNYKPVLSYSLNRFFCFRSLKCFH